jgi:hypothetical protein
MHELAMLTAFVAGLMGSAHCLGMCGGIATALGATRASGARALQPVLYQLGRVCGYGIAGAVAGALGAGVGIGFPGSRWSEILRLATALVVVLIGLDIAFGASARSRWMRAPERLGARLWRHVVPTARQHLPRSPAARALSLGLLWGWLPCGLVYSVLVAAAVAGSASAGALTMLAFGLGTWPAMLGLSYAGAWLPSRQGVFARLLGAVIVACGLWTATLPIAMLSGVAVHHHGSMPLNMPLNMPMNMPMNMAMPGGGTADQRDAALP